MAAILTMVVGVLVAAVVTVVAVFNPTSGPKGAHTSQGAEHSESAVRQAAQLALDSYSSGSYGDFWDLWSAQAQGLVKREDYVRLFELCPPLSLDTRFTVSDITITGDDATVLATGAGEAEDFAFVFEGGSWRYTPSSRQQQDYRTKTVDQLAQEQRSAGACGAAAPTSPPTAPLTSTPTAAPTAAPTEAPASPPTPTASPTYAPAPTPSLS
ncbi:hypothetical protein [Streptosporangium carneum]|uniref:hypothetical protein n=1 Tax=Streptosporangium carneum TaxID=47481 RepID=UPI0031E55FC6